MVGATGWSRIRGAGPLRFVLIVWSVALGFQALLGSGTRIVAWGLDHGVIAPTLAMAEVAADCQNAPAAAPATPIDPTTSRSLSFQLGLSLGIETGIRNTGGRPNASTKVERAALARRLGVATPEVPPLIHAANALSEFEVFLQQDPQCVSARLAAAYGPTSGAMYQFAAVVGHAGVYRTAAPLGPLFVPQLRVYGDRAGVPPDLWAVLAEDLSARPFEQARQDISHTVEALARHAAEAPHP